MSGTGVGRLEALLDRPPEIQVSHVLSNQALEIPTVGRLPLGRHGANRLDTKGRLSSSGKDFASS